MSSDKRTVLPATLAAPLTSQSQSAAEKAVAKRVAAPLRRVVPPTPQAHRNTGSKIMETLDLLADRARAQAAQPGELDMKLVRATRDLASAWSATHAEMRETIESMSDQEYMAVAQALGVDQAPPSADPLVGAEAVSGAGSSADRNFSPSNLLGGETSHKLIHFDPVVDFNED